jgi:choline monooxygenase
MSQRSDRLIALLGENAARDFRDAQSLPPAIYHDEDIYALEAERIFGRDWICAGRLAEVPNSGDYIAIDIIDQPVFVVRQADSSVKAFSNVCLHRSSRLLDDCGHVSRITCPYHSWTYELDGRLIGAPFMQDTANFDLASYRLRELRCDVWQGFVYVSLDPDAAAVSQLLSEFDSIIGPLEISDYVPVHIETELWNCNWKCLVENYMDVYHLHRVHANSFGKYGSFEDQTTFFPGNDAFCYHYVQDDGGQKSVAAHAKNLRLSGEDRYKTYLINIFPAHTIQLQPDMLWYLSILPAGPEQLKVRWSVSVPQDFLDDDDAGAEHLKENLDLILQVNSEDKEAVQRVQRGTAEHGATQGPLSSLERSVWDFGRYLSRRLCP